MSEVRKYRLVDRSETIHCFGLEQSDDAHYGDGWVSLADYDELKARLDTAERAANEREEFYAGVLNDAERVRVEQRDKLTHLERLVEGLPVVARFEVERMHKALVSIGCPLTADALAALLEHRKNMGAAQQKYMPSTWTPEDLQP